MESMILLIFLRGAFPAFLAARTSGQAGQPQEDQSICIARLRTMDKRNIRVDANAVSVDIQKSKQIFIDWQKMYAAFTEYYASYWSLTSIFLQTVAIAFRKTRCNMTSSEPVPYRRTFYCACRRYFLLTQARLMPA